MKLTKLQIKLLKFYGKHQTEPLTLFKIVRNFWLAWLVLLVLPAIGYWTICAGLTSFGWVVVGVGIGAFLRDVGRIQMLFRTWPAIHEIINWDRLNQLLQTSKKDGV